MNSHRFTWLINELVLFVFAGLLLTGSGSRAQDDAAKPDLEKIPMKVLDVLAARFPKAEIKECSNEKEGDVVVFTLKFKYGERNFKAHFTGDGTTFQWQFPITAKDLPEAVKRAVEKKYPESNHKEINQVLSAKDGRDAGELYKIVLDTVDKKEVELTLAIDGAIMADSGRTPREALRASAWYFNYPRGMIFATTFDNSLTTRLVLLKTALHSEKLAKYLSLDEQQRLHIEDLQPIRVDLKDRVDVDQNAQLDEQIVKTEYFEFLRPGQFQRLDVMALRFDGLSALSRQSLAKHLKLGNAAQQKIAAVISEIRDTVVLPRFRWEFAAPLPEDIRFRDCHFAGSICTQLNLQILDILTDEECLRLRELLKVLDHDSVTEVERLAPLPAGFAALYRWVK